MAYLLILRIGTAYNMRLKIVLHIKIQFVSSDFLIFNETHVRNSHSRRFSSTLWSFFIIA